MNETSKLDEHGRFYFKLCRYIFRKSSSKPDKPRKIPRQEGLRKALYFLGVKVEPHEVTFFASFSAIISFSSVLFTTILIFLLFPDTILLAIGIPAVLIIPIAVYYIVSEYPKILAKRIMVASLARTPEVINYMAMSMRVSPSLNKAIEFASENVDEPMASALKKILWDIYMKKHNSIEDAFLAFAYDWGDDEDFKRALYAIRSSALERTEQSLSRSLDKASETALSGTKRRIEEFVSTLSTPTTVLFSLGIILPLIIGAMLPMLSLSSMDFSIGMENPGLNSQTANPLGLILLMDIIFPAAGAFYAYHILGKRPGTVTQSEQGYHISRKSNHNLIIISAVIGSTLVAVGVLVVTLTQLIVGSFLIIWGIGLPIALYYFMTTRNQKKIKDKIMKMENELPDALFQLGCRIAEGNPVENALKMTAQTMKGSDIAKLFEKISFNIQITRSTLEDALFGSAGILNKFPSKTIKATMKIVVEISKKDALAAGQTIISISNYLKDMKKIEHEIKTSLKSSVDSMKATGLLFAPLVMGVTAGLYFLLLGAFEGFGASAQMIQPYLFLMIIGIYLLLTVIIIMYFCTGIENGIDPIERKHQTAFGLTIALLVFSVTTFLGQATLLP